MKEAKFGLMMPGQVKVGQRFYQELAHGVAMDRAEVVAAGETITTPAGSFKPTFPSCTVVSSLSDARPHQYP